MERNGLFGCPGRKSGLILRIGQFAFAVASLWIMFSTSDVNFVTAYWIAVLSWLMVNLFIFFSSLVAALVFQVLWSFTVACLDIYALTLNNNLYNPNTIIVFLVIDWVTATLILATTSSSAGVMVLYSRDTTECSINKFNCNMVLISICFAFMSWCLLAVTSYSIFFHAASTSF